MGPLANSSTRVLRSTTSISASRSIVARVSVIGRGLDAKLKHERAGLAWLDIEGYGTISPSGPKRDPLRGDGRSAAGRVLRATSRELNFHRLAGIAVGLQIAGDVERVVRKRARGNDQITDRDIALHDGRTDADRIERDLRNCCADSIAAPGSMPAFCAPSEITTTPASGASR